MNDTRKLQQERREKINKHKREIISKISPKERRMFGVVTQFAAELVWTYVDGLCDALASSKEDYKKECRKLRELRRSFIAKRNQILINEDEQHLVNLAELYQDCFDRQIKKLVFNLNGYYKRLSLNERLVFVGVEQVLTTYEAVEKFMDMCKQALFYKSGIRFSRLTHDEFYRIPEIVKPMLNGAMFDKRTPFVNEIVNILNSIVEQSEDD